jgi:hypothetical protein
VAICKNWVDKEAVMGFRRIRPELRNVFALAALAASMVVAGPALATGRPAAQKMWLACQNGLNYPIRPLAVSSDGDLVTGYLLFTGRGHAVHLRLVPMGVGYRYAGHGTWFDGMRGHAVLDWGTRNAVACTVKQE